MDRIGDLQRMLTEGRDNAVLRYALGNELLGAGQPDAAVTHLRKAVEHDPGYSAAWKSLGKALVAAGNHAEAVEAYGQGVSAAEQRGDVQAAKEMRVFLKRLRKQSE